MLSEDFLNTVQYLSNGALFPCLHSLILTRGGLGEFETVMQGRDVVEGFRNFQEFSKPPECLDQATGYVNTEKVLYCIYKSKSTRESETSQPCLHTLI